MQRTILIFDGALNCQLCYLLQRRETVMVLILAAVWHCLRITYAKPIFEENEIGMDDSGAYAAFMRAGHVLMTIIEKL